MSRKKFPWVALAAILCLAVAAVLLLQSQTDMVAYVNENSHLPVPLCTHETQVQPKESLMYVPGFGGYALDNDDICIHLSGWPDAGDEYHVTGIDLFSPGYDVLSVQVGQAFPSAKDTLLQHDFDQVAEQERWTCTRGDITVIVEEEQGFVTCIRLRVKTTNRNHLIF